MKHHTSECTLNYDCRASISDNSLLYIATFANYVSMGQSYFVVKKSEAWLFCLTQKRYYTRQEIGSIVTSQLLQIMSIVRMLIRYLQFLVFLLHNIVKSKDPVCEEWKPIASQCGKQ